MADIKDRVKEAMINELKKGAGYKETKKEEKPKVEEPEFDHEYDAPEDKMLASKVFGINFGNQVDPYITVFNPEDWDEDVRCDIPDPDPDYVFQPEVLGPLLMAMEHNEKPLLVGPPGTGKTSIVKEVAAYTKRPYMRLNGKDGVEPSSFLGTPWASDGGMEWKDGLVPIACKKGYLLAFDEPFKVGPGVNMALQWLYEDNGKLMLDDKPGNLRDKLVTPDPRFRMVLADNVKGLGDNIDKFGSTNVQDTASIDRFGMTMDIDYLPKEKEVEMMRNWFPELKENTAKKMVQLATLIRQGYKDDQVSLSMSPRGLKKWAKYALLYKDLGKSFRLTYYNKLADGAEQGAVTGMYRTVFDKDM